MNEVSLQPVIDTYRQEVQRRNEYENSNAVVYNQLVELDRQAVERIIECYLSIVESNV